jgi:uncharacterized membrane protein
MAQPFYAAADNVPSVGDDFEDHVHTGFFLNVSMSTMLGLLMLAVVVLYILSQTSGTTNDAFKWMMLSALLLSAMAFIILVMVLVLRPNSHMRNIVTRPQ